MNNEVKSTQPHKHSVDVKCIFKTNICQSSHKAVSRIATLLISSENSILQHTEFPVTKNTPNFGLLYSYQSKNTQVDNLNCFVDADLAGNKCKKSTTGFVVRMCGTPVTWDSRLKTTIFESSDRAEFVAMCDSAHSALFLSRLAEEIISIIIIHFNEQFEEYREQIKKFIKVGVHFKW